MNKEFAPNYERDEKGRILFPEKDTILRYLHFTYTDSNEHVAKCNMYMIKELVEYVSEPGETILDPFAGTGTILIAATMGRKVICIEIEPLFQDIVESNIAAMGIKDSANLVRGDCSKILPVPGVANHAIFSPPWAQILRKKSVDSFGKDMGYGSATSYTNDPYNIGNLSDFLYHQKMEKVYRKLFDTLTPGGTLTIIIKDRSSGGERIKYGARARKDCLRIGYEPVSWHRWYVKGGGFAKYNRSVGIKTVDEEDLITLRKPV
jgi:methylase of polypeptide subunit release factors